MAPFVHNPIWRTSHNGEIYFTPFSGHYQARHLIQARSTLFSNKWLASAEVSIDFETYCSIINNNPLIAKQIAEAGFRIIFRGLPYKTFAEWHKLLEDSSLSSI